MKRKIFIIVFFLGSFSLNISNGQLVEGAMTLLNLTGAKGKLSGITNKITGLLNLNGGSKKVDKELIEKLSRIKKLMENSLCLMREFEFNSRFYVNSNSCLYNIHKEQTLINYSYALNALDIGIEAISDLIGGLTGKSSGDNDEAKIDKIITQGEIAVAQLEELNGGMQAEIYASIYKSYELKGSIGFGSHFSMRIKNIF